MAAGIETGRRNTTQSLSSNFPRLRRSSSRLSNTSDEPEPILITGMAVLCFKVDGESFKGVIHGDSNYSIRGVRAHNPEHLNCSDSSTSDSSSEDEESVRASYNIKIRDHDDFSEHSLKGIRIKAGRKCTFSFSNISFTSTESYIGSKAQMVAHSCLGHVDDHEKLIVHKGEISITVFEKKHKPRYWLL